MPNTLAKALLVLVLLQTLSVAQELDAVVFLPPQNYTAFVPPPDFPLLVVLACPNGTGNVVAAEYNLALQIEYTQLGCCALGQYGIPTSFGWGLAGCCPIGQYPCVDDSETLIGCVDDPALCCGSIICSPGYGCCPHDISPANLNYTSGYPCCPLFGTSIPSNFDAYCQVYNDTVYLESNFGEPMYGGCGQATLMAAVPCLFEYVYDLINGTELVDFSVSNVYCAHLSECFSTAQALGLVNVTLFDNSTALANTTFYSPVGCCAAGLTPCPGPDGGVVACANATRGEVCCGDEVCPVGSSCCEFPSLSDPSIMSVYGCCASGLECCIRSPYSLSDANLYNVTQLYCGATYQNVSCAFDMYANNGFPQNS